MNGLMRQGCKIPEVFGEVAINHELVIPSQKPPMEVLLSYTVDFEITKAEVIDTKLTAGKDSQTVPLRKVIVDGTAKITVKYAADVPDQQVHGAHFDVPFNALVEWPDGPPEGEAICVEVVPEHVQIDQIDSRRLRKVIVIQVNICKQTCET
ncbi:MAG: DUF3794 domain-containing protein [Desulfotomaculaceae bacterium]